MKNKACQNSISSHLFFYVTFSLIFPLNLHLRLLPFNQIKSRKSECCLNQNQGLTVLNFPILCQKNIFGGAILQKHTEKLELVFPPLEYLDCLICPKFKVLLACFKKLYRLRKSPG